MPLLCLALGFAVSGVLIGWLAGADQGLRLRTVCLPAGTGTSATAIPTHDVLCDLKWRDVAGAVWLPGVGLALLIAGLWNTFAVLARFLTFVANDRR